MTAFKAISAKEKKKKKAAASIKKPTFELSRTPLLRLLSVCFTFVMPFLFCPENFLLLNTTVPLHDGSDVLAAEFGINSSRDAHQIFDGNS